MKKKVKCNYCKIHIKNYYNKYSNKYYDKLYCSNICKNLYIAINNYNTNYLKKVNKYFKNFIKKKKNIDKFPHFNILDKINIYNVIYCKRQDNELYIKLIIPNIINANSIWLLNNLPILYNNVYFSNVTYSNKELLIIYKYKKKISILFILLYLIGYSPIIDNINNIKIRNKSKTNKINNILFRLLISFFSFANIMLFYLPEYIDYNNNIWLIENRFYFYIISYILIIPSMVFCANMYIYNAYKSLLKFKTSISIPISIGIILLFIRSTCDIFIYKTSGYLDSLSGLIFLLLFGKFIKKYTFKKIKNSINYNNYFPTAIYTINNGIKSPILINKLSPGDKILIRNKEIIPVDSILIDNINIYVEVSFITGEDKLQIKKKNDIIFAGSRYYGNDIITLRVINNFSTSYLYTFLNKNINNIKKNKINKIINNFIFYFSPIILLISLISMVFWYIYDINRIINSVISILIVACPCSLYLSSPIIYTKIKSIFVKKSIFILNNSIIEYINKINLIIFDKTGTLSYLNIKNIKYYGKKLSKKDIINISNLLFYSNHPISVCIYNYLSNKKKKKNVKVNKFKEDTGLGIKGVIDNNIYKIGSYLYMSDIIKFKKKISKSYVLVSKNNKILGYFRYKSKYKCYVLSMLKYLSNNYKVCIITGDNDNDFEYLYNNCHLRNLTFFFKKSPLEKINIIKYFQNIGYKILMIGDGINDIGALKQSNASISVYNNNILFHESDIIFSYKSVRYIPKFINLVSKCNLLISINIIISIIYNIIGIWFSFNDLLSPIISAILMPLSSICVIIFSNILVLIFKYIYK